MSFKRTGDVILPFVPNSWSVASLRRVIRTSSGGTPPTEAGEHIVYGSNGPIGRASKFNISHSRIVIGRVGASGSVNIAPAYSWVSDNALIVEIHRPDLMNFRYLEYVLRALRLDEYASKTAQPLITSSMVLSRRVGLPPIGTQRAIADFLDRKTAAIDALIQKKEKLIELLDEKRAALINKAVTKGLDPNVPMKDSGIPWIGEIPAHWRMMQLRRQITLQRGVDITKEEQRHGSVPVVSSGGIASHHDTAFMQGPGVLVGRKGSVGNVHWVDEDYWPHDTTLYVSWFGENHRRFVFYKLISMRLEHYDTGSSNPTLNRNVVHPVTLSWPLPEEQLEIAGELDRKLQLIAKVVERTKDSIRRLSEYRVSLITAGVTGQIASKRGRTGD